MKLCARWTKSTSRFLLSRRNTRTTGRFQKRMPKGFAARQATKNLPKSKTRWNRLWTKCTKKSTSVLIRQNPSWWSCLHSNLQYLCKTKVTSTNMNLRLMKQKRRAILTRQHSSHSTPAGSTGSLSKARGGATTPSTLATSCLSSRRCSRCATTRPSRSAGSSTTSRSA